MSIEALPADIHVIITTCLLPKDISHLCLVNRQLRQQYQPQLFREIDDVDVKLSHNPYLLLRTLMLRPALASRVISISLAPYPQNWLAAHNLPTEESSDMAETLKGALMRYTDQVPAGDLANWITAVSLGRSDAILAAILFLCTKLKSLELDLTYVQDATYMQMLGHIASVQNIRGESDHYPHLSSISLEDNPRNVNYQRQTALIPLTYLPGVKSLTMKEIYLDSTHLGNPQRMANDGQTLIQVKNIDAKMTQVNGSLQPNQSFLGITRYLQRCTGLTCLCLNTPGALFLTPLQNALNAAAKTLTNLDILSSDIPKNSGQEKRFLTLGHFTALEKLSTQAQHLCQGSNHRRVDPDHLQSLDMRLPPNLRELQIQMDLSDAEGVLGQILLMRQHQKIHKLKYLETPMQVCISPGPPHGLTQDDKSMVTWGAWRAIVANLEEGGKEDLKSLHLKMQSLKEEGIVVKVTARTVLLDRRHSYPPSPYWEVEHRHNPQIFLDEFLNDIMDHQFVIVSEDMLV